ncbi:PAS domain-containing protein [Halapricum sp. CBA1109]|uniref:sensor histidine kinase n=1 Tax=Halapricum sp. CBA1109 TaxID=2668068 RepID=UPI0012F829E0|nr:PAS domain-containing protein [Halapricum sp. CBA1109]
MVADSPSTVRVCFVDVDGRLGPMIQALDDLEKPITVERVSSVEAAGAAGETTDFDCFVVRGAMATASVEPSDGIETCQRVRAVLPGVPAAIYSVNLDHNRLRAAFEADIAVVSDAPGSPELVYRQLRYAAGMEEHVQSPAELLDSLFAYYPHHLFLKDEVGRFEALSDATAREYNLDPDVIEGLTDFDLLEYDTAVEAYREEQALMETGDRIVERIDHWVDEDGRDRWMSITKAPRYDDEGTPVGIVGSTREVTREKRKEQMVRELHTVSRELVRAQTRADIGRAVMAVTDDVPVFSHIQVVLREDGSHKLQPLGDGEGETLFDRHEERFRAVVDGGAAQYVTAAGDVVDDPELAVDLETAVLPLGEHGALGVAADTGPFTEFGIDLTNILAANLEATLDRAERERELQRQNERLEEFASIVSHDLRNPLNVASGATELLAEEHDSPQIDRITDALDRMEQLIEALLTLARKGQVVGETEFVDLADAARDAWQVVDAPSATMTVEGSVGVVADRNRLIELFENLFRNAVEHGGETVTVEVGVREAGDGFYVADDGAGFGTSDTERLFDMGYSGADGTGYGLYIVSTIAESHGWTVTAGAGEDGGARFDVSGVGIERPGPE